MFITTMKRLYKHTYMNVYIYAYKVKMQMNRKVKNLSSVVFNNEIKLLTKYNPCGYCVCRKRRANI